MTSNTVPPALGSDNPPLSQSESAFPLADHGEFLATGLTKREFFAAMAMQGLLAQETENWNFGSDSSLLARVAVEQADRLMDALLPD